jgi:hypothetical protein
MDKTASRHMPLRSRKKSLSRFVSFMIPQVPENFVVALERIEILWKPGGKTQDTGDDRRIEDPRYGQRRLLSNHL